MDTTPRRARRTAGLLLAMTALAALASCSADESSSTSEGAPAVAPERAAKAPAADSSAGGAEKGSSPTAAKPADEQAAQVGAPGVDRKLVRTASLELGATDVGAAADAVRSEVLAAGGYSGQESVSERTANLTLFVPSDRLDAVLAKITDGGAGTVRTRGQNAEDVTEQTVDVESRIKTQRASLDRVRVLLASATSVDDIVRIESEVTRREADLESLLARQDRLAGSVAMSTVTVRVVRSDAPVAVAEPEDTNSFLAALAAGWDGFLTAGGFVLRLVGYVLPFAVLLGLVGWLVLRLRRRAGQPAPAPAAATEA